jgi:hypothetical protein
MSETRRQIFKTSILSAFGLMAVPVVAACSPHGLFGLGSKDLDPQVPVVGYGKGNWYIIVYDATKAGYVVYKAGEDPPSDPAVTPFDTARWYVHLDGANKLKQVTICYIDGVGALSFDGEILSGPSVGILQSAARTKWSEVGNK